MHQFFVEPGQINLQDKSIIISGQDVNHIRNVLRMKVGEELSVSNGLDGREYRCGILAMEEERILCELRFIRETGVELPARIHLFQALPKADKMELIIQKAKEEYSRMDTMKQSAIKQSDSKFLEFIRTVLNSIPAILREIPPVLSGIADVLKALFPFII